jgi:hypothetical protein
MWRANNNYPFKKITNLLAAITVATTTTTTPFGV